MANDPDLWPVFVFLFLLQDAASDLFKRASHTRHPPHVQGQVRVLVHAGSPVWTAGGAVPDLQDAATALLVSLQINPKQYTLKHEALKHHDFLALWL